MVLTLLLSLAGIAERAWALWAQNGIPLISSSSIAAAPDPAPGPSGNLYVTCYDGYSLRVLSIQPDGTVAPGWPSAGVVAASFLSSYLIEETASTDGQGGVIVFYREVHFGGGVSDVATRVDGTGSVPTGWPVGVAFSSYLSGVGDGFGGAVAAWNVRQTYGNEALSAKRLGPSGTAVWSYAAGAANLNDSPTAAPDGLGGGIFAWRCEALRVDGAGAHVWNSALPTCGTVGESPVAISDGAGGALVAWTEGTDVRALRLDSNGSVATGWNASGTIVGQADDSDALITMISDQNGGAIIGWVSPFHGPERVQRVTPAGSVAGGWSPLGTAVSPPIQVQEKPALAGDGNGGVYVAWTDYRAGTSVPSDITAEHILGSGSIAPGWGPLGSPICNAPKDQSLVRVVSDGAGGVYVTWEDRRGPAVVDYYGQHVGAADNLPLAVEPTRGAAPALAIAPPSPNPLRRDADLSVTLSDRGPSVLELFDAAGRRAAEIRMPDAAPGTRSVRISTSALNPGIYQVRLTQGARVAFSRIVIVR